MKKVKTMAQAVAKEDAKERRKYYARLFGMMPEDIRRQIMNNAYDMQMKNYEIFRDFENLLKESDRKPGEARKGINRRGLGRCGEGW